MKTTGILFAMIGAACVACAQDWTPCGWGGGGFFWCAAFHPARDGVIYMGGDVNGVYKTEDHGCNWRIINNGIANYGVYSLAVDRANPQTVYAATEGGLCMSADAGEHWQLLPQTGPKELHITGERRKTIRSVAVDPTDGKIVYAASPAGKIFRSADGGQSWSVIYERQESAEAVESVRVQFGKVNEEWYGGLWIPVEFPKDADAKNCDGIGFAFKGGGVMPKDAFLTLKLANGASYRSRNLRDLFADTNWRDVVLKGADFALDSEFAKKDPEKAKALPATPDWSAVQRFDLSSVRTFENEAAACRLSRFFFAFADSKQNRTICDAAGLKKASFYANVHMGAESVGNIFSVVVSAKKPSLVLAATETAGVIISEDSGRTWRQAPTPKKAANITVADSDANIMFASCFKDGIWKSADAGKTWTDVSQGLGKNFNVIETVVSPANPLDVFAISMEDWGGHFYSSQDGGQTWTNSSQLAVDHDGNPTHLQGGDSAKTGMSAPSNLAMNPKNPQELFISANWRSCWSDDGGKTWAERDRGADISCVYDIRFHKGRAYAAAMDEGAFVSPDNGKSWKQIAPTRNDATLAGHCWRLAISDNNGVDRILATFSPWWNKYPNRVVISEDGGKTYQIATEGLPDYIPSANTMWGAGAARALAADPNDPNIVYLGIDGDPHGKNSGGGIFKSSDGGRTWKQLPNQPGSRRVFSGLAVDPTDSRRIYWAGCGSHGGLYRSDDGGGSWQHVFKNETWPFNVMVSDDGTVYCPGRDLWRSADHGKTWKRLTKRADDGGVIVGLACDSKDPKRIWHSVNFWDNSSRGGIFKSADAGETWTEITGNIPYRKPVVLRFNPDAGELWAGGVGLYRIKQ